MSFEPVKGVRSEFAEGILIEGVLTAIEWQTDKDAVKVCPCTECGTPVGANVFYAPAKARCNDHGGGASRAAAPKKGSLAVVQPGRTDPANAANLSDCLLNKQFMDPPLCPFDPEHDVELKSITHNPNYGPSHIIGYEKGHPIYRNDVGEVAFFQCNDCKTSISFSTTHQLVYRRQNEARVGEGTQPSSELLLGARHA